jgi:hypothetical protein
LYHAQVDTGADGGAVAPLILRRLRGGIDLVELGVVDVCAERGIDGVHVGAEAVRGELDAVGQA